MLNLVKKSAYLGLGLAAMTKEKVEEFAKNVIEDKNLSEEEGKKLVNEIYEESKKAKGKVETLVEKFVKKSLTTINIPQKSEIQKLEARIIELEKLLPKDIV